LPVIFSVMCLFVFVCLSVFFLCVFVCVCVCVCHVFNGMSRFWPVMVFDAV